MKSCTKCQMTKPYEAFAKRAKAKDGFASYCRECQAEYTKTWRAENADKLKADKAAHYAANKSWYNAKHKEYREANKAELAVNKMLWRLHNADANKEYWRQYRKANAEAVAAYNARWRDANPKVYQAVVANHNANRRTATKSGVSAQELRKWVKEQPKVCFYCCGVCEDEYHIDHFEPLARGGAHELDNLKIACRVCNSEKSARNPLEYMGFL